MSRATHEQFLRKSARGSVIRESRRRSGAPLTLDRVRELKVQTMEPWKRVVSALVGLLFCLAGSFAWNHDVTGLSILLFGLGAIFVLMACFGRKRTMKAILDKVDVGDIVSGIIDLIDV